MGEKQAFLTNKAAVTGGPYLQAIIHKDLINTRVEIDSIAHI
jgi:hypothetical protein